MIGKIRRWVKRNQIKAANDRDQAVANFQAAIARKDTRKQHELEPIAQAATIRALRLGA
jgi:hypothetical protein